MNNLQIGLSAVALGGAACVTAFAAIKAVFLYWVLPVSAALESATAAL